MIPKVLKRKVTPLFKGGDSLSPTCYRPISVTPLLGKVLEKTCYLRLSRYLYRQEVPAKRQFGFKENSSTAVALVQVLDKLYKGCDSGKRCGVLFGDFSKAFDLVNHNILLQKLEHYGVRGNALQWFKLYLTSCTQSVENGEVLSSNVPITCGIPQGGNISTLLFSTFINDITRLKLYGNIFLFADDACNVIIANNDE